MDDKCIYEIPGLLEEYFRDFRLRFIEKQDSKVLEITTPYLDRHNDYLQIYVIPNDDKYILSDDGYILNFEEDTNKYETIYNILNMFGVSLKNGVLTTQATRENFVIKKHNLIQSMLVIDSMYII